MKSDRYSQRVPLELLCFSLLKERDMYGYEMVRMIEQRSNHLLVLNITTLYVVVKKLCEKGYVSAYYQDSLSRRGRSRLYYHIEDSANSYYNELMNEYQRTTQGVSIFFTNTEQK